MYIYITKSRVLAGPRGGSRARAQRQKAKVWNKFGIQTCASHFGYARWELMGLPWALVGPAVSSAIHLETQCGLS